MVGVVLLCLGKGVNLLDWLRVVGIVCFVLGKSASELLREWQVFCCVLGRVVVSFMFWGRRNPSWLTDRVVSVVLLCLGEGVNLLDWLRVVGVRFVSGKSVS